MYQEKQSNRIIISSGIGRFPFRPISFYPRDLSSLGLLDVPPRIDKQNTRCVNNLNPPPRVIFPRSQTSIPASKFSSPSRQTIRGRIIAGSGDETCQQQDANDAKLIFPKLVCSSSTTVDRQKMEPRKLFFVWWAKNHFLLSVNKYIILFK